MAKRYIRINFQNSPSTATPLNATNLNILDKGIDDCDNAIEDINNRMVQLDTINDSTKYPSSAVTYAHGQSLKTLNDNLASQTFVRTRSDVDSLGDFDLALSNGIYIYYGNSILHSPNGVANGILLVINLERTYIAQIFFCNLGAYWRFANDATSLVGKTWTAL